MLNTVLLRMKKLNSASDHMILEVYPKPQKEFNLADTSNTALWDSAEDLAKLCLNSCPTEMVKMYMMVSH